VLTQYDEYPVHQSPHPFSQIPSTDVSWDDGYYHAIWSADEGLFVHASMRVNPNMDVVAGSINLTVDGTQYTIRLSRVWRPNCDTRIGPYGYQFIEPFKTIRVFLEPNESPVSFDFNWIGTAPAFLEDHHVVTWRQRRVIDQSRYNQPGTGEGWIQVKGKRYNVNRKTWGGSRDHSWGLYEGRRPLANLKEYMPPGPPPSGRAMRFWTMFNLPNYSGFFGIHEDKDGVCRSFDDFLGTAFEGVIDYGWTGKRVALVGARHELTFRPGTRMLTGGKVFITDAEGGEWKQEFQIGTLPFLFAPIGYWVGSWRDGGTMQTYHGEGPVLEWDEIDISKMPMDYQPPGQPPQKNAQGHIYGARVKMTTPDGTVSEGMQHVTFWVEGDYHPYGFRAAAYP